MRAVSSAIPDEQGMILLGRGLCKLDFGSTNAPAEISQWERWGLSARQAEVFVESAVTIFCPEHADWLKKG
jgi:hypothetical protein